MEREYLTIADVATMLGVSKPTVRKAVDERGLPAIRLGERTYRFSRVAVDNWINEQQKGSHGRRSA